MSKLLYVGQQTADFLADNVEKHIDRYTVSGFEDLESSGDWRIPLSISADLTSLKDLIPENGREAEIHNSLTVGRALASLTPALARENRIWVRLSHIEALEYTRERWVHGASEEKISNLIRIHFFASTWTQCRDDHSISRLWWNHRIATMLTPNDPEKALNLILLSADIRMHLVERSRSGMRMPLARAIIRALNNDESLKPGKNFNKFMQRMNKNAAGRQIEVWSDREIDQLLERCTEP